MRSDPSERGMQFLTVPYELCWSVFWLKSGGITKKETATSPDRSSHDRR